LAAADRDRLSVELVLTFAEHLPLAEPLVAVVIEVLYSWSETTARKRALRAVCLASQGQRAGGFG